MTFLSDGKAHTGKEILNHVVEHFNLSEDDISELLPSKNGTRLATNFSWAKSFLKVAKLITSPKRNTFIITDEGMKLLAKQPQRIDTKLLSQYPSFKEWQQQGKKDEKRNPCYPARQAIFSILPSICRKEIRGTSSPASRGSSARISSPEETVRVPSRSP